jgi:hypothetical protein
MFHRVIVGANIKEAAVKIVLVDDAGTATLSGVRANFLGHLFRDFTFFRRGVNVHRLLHHDVKTIGFCDNGSCSKL